MASSAGSRVTATPATSGSSTPLGPAANRLNQPKKSDMSLLRPGLSTTVTGMRQAVHALESGTGEVRSYLLHEVNLIYECKVCHNMFRSLANLIAHKRSFCRAMYQTVSHIYQDSIKAAELETVVVEAEPVTATHPESTWDIENYAPSLELLKDAGILQDIVSRPVVNRLLPAKKPTLDSMVATLKAKAGCTDIGYYENQKISLEERRKKAASATLHLEPINETNNGLFQTWRVKPGEEGGNTTGQNYRLIQEKETPVIVAVGPNNRELPKGVPPGMQQGPVSPGGSEGSKENHAEEETSFKVKFPCPETDCKKQFSSIKTVYKHLVKSHNKTMEMAKDLRKQIKAGATKIKGDQSHQCQRCWRIFKTSQGLGSHKPCKGVILSNSSFEGVASPIKRINAYVKIKKLAIDVEKFREGGSPASSRRSSVSEESQSVLEEAVANRDAKDKEEVFPKQVESKILEYISHRNVKCNVCQQKFARTVALKRHVAGVHLELDRWVCTICSFGSWTKDECIRHATQTHRLRTNDPAPVVEKSFEEYFKEYLDEDEGEAIAGEEVTGEEDEEKNEEENERCKEEEKAKKTTNADSGGKDTWEKESDVSAASSTSRDENENRKIVERKMQIIDETVLNSDIDPTEGSFKVLYDEDDEFFNGTEEQEGENAVKNINIDEEVSFKETELKKRKRSHSDSEEDSLTGSENSSKRSCSGTHSPAVIERGSRDSPSNTLFSKVISSLGSFIGGNGELCPEKSKSNGTVVGAEFARPLPKVPLDLPLNEAEVDEEEGVEMSEIRRTRHRATSESPKKSKSSS